MPLAAGAHASAAGSPCKAISTRGAFARRDALDRAHDVLVRSRPRRPHLQPRTRHPAGEADRRRRGVDRRCAPPAESARPTAAARRERDRLAGSADAAARSATTVRVRATPRIPTAVEFHDGFGEADYRDALRDGRRGADEPLSLYVHLPFCEERCVFCGCNVVITPQRAGGRPYLDYLEQRDRPARRSTCRERRRVVAAPLGRRHADLLLSPTQIERSSRDRAALHVRAGRRGRRSRSTRASPRASSSTTLRAPRLQPPLAGRAGLRRRRCRRRSTASRATSRRAPSSSTRARCGFASINVDLIYGLPLPDARRVRAHARAGARRCGPTASRCTPSRYVPWMRATRGTSPREALPAPELKLALLGAARDAFAARATAIGMDHFALPDDELARAADSGTLHRNFMGYTVQSARDMVASACRASATCGGAFVQNVKKLTAYYAALDGRALPDRARLRARRRRPPAPPRHQRADVQRRASTCDEVERAVRHRLRRLLRAGARRARRPGAAAADGLVEIGRRRIERDADSGRLFVRNVCMVFDRYLRARTAGRQARLQPHRMTPRKSWSSEPASLACAAAVRAAAPRARAGAAREARRCRVLEARRIPAGTHTRIRKNGFRVEAGPNGWLDRDRGADAVQALVESGWLIVAPRGEAPLHRARTAGCVACPQSPAHAADHRALSLRGRPAGAGRAVRARSDRAASRRRSTSSRAAVSAARRRRCSSIPPSRASPPATAASLSVAAKFPLMTEIERDHGGFIQGDFREVTARSGRGSKLRRSVTPRGGTSTLTAALARRYERSCSAHRSGRSCAPRTRPTRGTGPARTVVRLPTPGRARYARRNAASADRALRRSELAALLAGVRFAGGRGRRVWIPHGRFPRPARRLRLPHDARGEPRDARRRVGVVAVRGPRTRGHALCA